MITPRPGRLTIAVVHPDLLGTYGDGGNGLILARRAAWRGLDVELLQAPSNEPLPRADLYTVGGGEDGPQVRAATTLIEEGILVEAVGDGAVVLGVCAGFQLLGRSFPDATGRPHEGLGLLDVTTTKGSGPRAVGELVASCAHDAPRMATGDHLPRLTGFENHGGVTSLGPGVRPLAHVEHGVGNGAGDQTEGAWSGRVLGTYLHGPVLARNTALADLLLGWALAPAGSPEATVAQLASLEDADEMSLRAERLEAMQRIRPARRLRRRTSPR